MKKQIHHILAEYYLKVVPNLKNEAFERQRQTDNVVVWIVGLSTGVLALILSNVEKITFLSVGGLKIVVICLLLSILSGVVFRAFIYTLEGL
ncbi:MAG: hypothetical protein A2447_02490 [Omnitrophica WOR_2 bacterium RIFOXYC2_FULL_38_12]|nr:MAG: hypothetical protein A2447_02490 [Omnitrophica WOR_2 bacterium RIFOXYC2_FULL_38_12]